MGAAPQRPSREPSRPGQCCFSPRSPPGSPGRERLLAVRQPRRPVAHCLGHWLTDAESPATRQLRIYRVGRCCTLGSRGKALFCIPSSSAPPRETLSAQPPSSPDADGSGIMPQSSPLSAVRSAPTWTRTPHGESRQMEASLGYRSSRSSRD